MKVKNTTKEDLHVVINGREYSVKAESSVFVPKEDAFFWAKKIHQFLILEEGEEVKTKVAEIKEEKIEEVIEVKEEKVTEEPVEVIEEKPKKVIKTKKVK